jgi:hypothetical protein
VARINICIGDFDAVAQATLDAQSMGNRVQAEALDYLARKINASLANTQRSGFLPDTAISADDVPSLLDGPA